MSVKVFYTSIYGFLPHQLSRPSVHAVFRLTYEKHEMSERTLGYMLPPLVRDTAKPLFKQL